MPKNTTESAVTNYKTRLRDAAKEAETTSLTATYGSLATEMAAIPQGLRAQMTLLLDAKSMHFLRRQKELAGVSPQDFVREAVQEAIVRRTAKQLRRA